MAAYALRSGAILNPRVIMGRVYVKHHITLQHAKYASFGSCGFKEDFFFHMFFICISLWQIMRPLGVACVDPRGMVGRFHK